LFAPTAAVAALLALLQLAIAGPAAALEPLREYVQTPEQAGISYEDVSFVTADSVVIHGWFLPFQDREGAAHGRAGPIIVIAPPDEENMGALLWHYYHFFWGAPWHVLVFDWRGFGASGDWPIDEQLLVLPEFNRDLHAAIDYAKTRPEWDEEHLGVFAFGMGAAVSMAVAADREDLTCLALRGLYTTQEELAANLQLAMPDRAVKVNSAMRPTLEPRAAAKRVTAPVLIVVGDLDAIATPEMAARVGAALGDRGRVWTAHGAGHAPDRLPEMTTQREFTAQLHSFLRRYLGTINP
jgi:pimeloyl-ACP methyl ester carboxylesterase